jgi:hypothetical protein
LTQAWIAGASAFVVAVTGALLAYLNTTRLSQKQARIERLNAQLGELYGPMLATLASTRRAHRTFLAEYAPERAGFFVKGAPSLSEAELATWRLWVETVFQPGNRRIYELIVTKAHLLIDDQMPDVLLDLCAHTVAFDVLVSRWSKKDYGRHTSVIPHPGGPLDEYARKSFTRLKKEQERLLKMRAHAGRFMRSAHP